MSVEEVCVICDGRLLQAQPVATVNAQSLSNEPVCGTARDINCTYFRPRWLFTIVCHTYATTDVIRHNAYRRYDLFTKSVLNLIGRTPGCTCTALRWPVSATTYFFLFQFRQLFKFLFTHNMYSVQCSNIN